MVVFEVVVLVVVSPATVGLLMVVLRFVASLAMVLLLGFLNIFIESVGLSFLCSFRESVLLILLLGLRVLQLVVVLFLDVSSGLWVERMLEFVILSHRRPF